MSSEAQGEKPTKADLEAKVASEAAKRTAKKAAQKRTQKRTASAGSGGAKVKVRITTASRGVKVGATRTLPKTEADRLIRQGHARKA